LGWKGICHEQFFWIYIIFLWIFSVLLEVKWAHCTFVKYFMHEQLSIWKYLI
jgi:hypothetical protein